MVSGNCRYRLLLTTYHLLITSRLLGLPAHKDAAPARNRREGCAAMVNPPLDEQHNEGGARQPGPDFVLALLLLHRGGHIAVTHANGRGRTNVRLAGIK